MQRWTSKTRQARKGAAVAGFMCAVGCLATFLYTKLGDRPLITEQGSVCFEKWVDARVWFEKQNAFCHCGLCGAGYAAGIFEKLGLRGKVEGCVFD